MRVELTSMKKVLASLAESVSAPLGLTAAASVTDTLLKMIFWIRDENTDNLKRRNERYPGNS